MRCVLLLLALCSATATVARERAPENWRRAIRDDDRNRLMRLWSAWNAAHQQVIAAGKADDWLALGPLVEPTPAMTGAAPPPGSYRCRMIKLGTQNGSAAAISTGPRVPCRIETDETGRLSLAGGDGAQRSNGALFADGERLVYLGAMSLRSDMAPFAYGRDPDRNQVGVLERIGPMRWRLAMPWPRWQSTIDVVDIVPAI